MKKYITAPLFIALFLLYSLYSFAVQHSRALLNLSASYTLFSADTARFITENYIWFQLFLTAVLAIFLVFLFFICKKSDDISAVYRGIFAAMALCAVISLIMGFYVSDLVTPYIVPLITMSAYTLAVPLLAKAADKQPTAIDKKLWLFPAVYTVLHLVRSLTKIYLVKAMESFSQNPVDAAILWRGRVNDFIYFFEEFLLEGAIWAVLIFGLIVVKKVGFAAFFRLSLVAFIGSLAVSAAAGLIFGVPVDFNKLSYALWDIFNPMANAAPMLFGFPLLCGIKLILASVISALIETPQKEQTDI